MNRATTNLFRVLGTLAGIMGIEHGIGELATGYRPTEGIFILSWPEAPFFEIMAGEPAMTLMPNYLLTGFLAIILSSVFLLLLLRPSPEAGTIAVLFVLVALMLLFGAGFGPPILGFIALLVALKRDSSLRLWKRLPSRVHQLLGALWPWSFGLCLAGWLMLFPGAALIAYLTGSDSALLMALPLLVAFGLIPITLALGFSRDIRRREVLPPARAA